MKKFMLIGFIVLLFFASVIKVKSEEKENDADSLIAVLSDTNARVRAAKALGECVDTTAVEALVDALDDRDNNVRFMAAISLGKIGDKRAIESLISIFMCARSSPIVFSFSSYGLPVILPCSTYVPGMGEDTLASEEEIREAAKWALKSIGEDAVEPLIETLKDESANVRYLVLNTLRDISHERVFESMVTLLEDENEYIRANAAQALGYTGNKKAIKPLKELLDDEEVELVKKAATRAIKELKKKKK